MEHLKEYESVVNEGQDINASASVSDYEFSYKGLDFMVSFDAEGEVSYEAPEKEEGHGFHEVGGGMMVNNITISNMDLKVGIFDKYASVSPDQEIMKEIENFLITDKDSLENIEEELIEAYADSE